MTDEKQRTLSENSDEAYIATHNLFPCQADSPVGWFVASFWGVRPMPAAWVDKTVQRYFFLFRDAAGKEILAGVVAKQHALSSSMSGRIWTLLSGFKPAGGILSQAVLEPYVGQKLLVKVEPRQSRGTGRWYALVLEVRGRA